jgi:hypothetical protein
VSETATGPSAFAKLKASPRRRGPLSFDDLSASLADAQRATGFVDTLTADTPHSVENDVRRKSAESNGSRRDGSTPPQPALPAVSATDTDPRSQEMQNQSPTDGDRRAPASDRRKGRVRASHVQCNLKIAEELRDALHLQALRERRTIADLVTEVMGEYLTRRGTFERLR